MNDTCPKCGGGLVVVTWYTGAIERLCLSCRVAVSDGKAYPFAEPPPGCVTVRATTKETG